MGKPASDSRSPRSKKRSRSNGHIHWIIPLLVVLLVTAVGYRLLTYSKADSVQHVIWGSYLRGSNAAAFAAQESWMGRKFALDHEYSGFGVDTIPGKQQQWDIANGKMPLLNWSELSVSELPTGTVTLLLADVEGSTRLWETQSDTMTTALEQLNRTVNDRVAGYGHARSAGRRARWRKS